MEGRTLGGAEEIGMKCGPQVMTRHPRVREPYGCARATRPAGEQGTWEGAVQHSRSLSATETILRHSCVNCLADTETHKAKGGAEKAAGKTQHPFLTKPPSKPG